MIYGIWNLSQNNQQAKKEKVKSISIWVVWDTSEQYQNLFSEFWKFNKQYEDTTLDIRVFPDYEKYQRILLSTLSEWTGPDLFMLEWWGDDILESKIIPIPDPIINLADFDKKYEDIFLPLLKTQWEGEEITRSILGIPLWYETLWLFYHKSLLRTIPKTWAELQTLSVQNGEKNIFASNLWLGPLYTPNATDIIAYFIGKSGKARNTENIQSWKEGLSDYLSYATTSIEDINTPPQEWENIWDQQIPQESTTLLSARKDMDAWLLSTVDLFMRGRIAIVVGYPSLIRELEKAGKRASEELLDDLILTEKLPQDSLGNNRANIARYKYLGISKKTQNPEASAQILLYLMSDIWSSKTREVFPLLISPLRSVSVSQKETPLSTVFARTRLDAFIPDLQDDVFVYNYSIKPEYEKIFREYIDRNEKIDINNVTKVIQRNISCELESTLSGILSDGCIKEE